MPPSTNKKRETVYCPACGRDYTMTQNNKKSTVTTIKCVKCQNTFIRFSNESYDDLIPMLNYMEEELY